MRTPKTLAPLLEDGLIDHVIQPLRSGKEADLFVVATAHGVRCAKVYKEARQRGFRQAGLYQEGRTVRDSRRGRAMAKKSRFGRHEREEVWQNAEVDALFRLADAGVRKDVLPHHGQRGWKRSVMGDNDHMSMLHEGVEGR